MDSERESPAWPYGPTLHEDGVTFRAFSPSAQRMELLIAPETPYERRIEMDRAAEEGFFERFVPGLGAGTRYRLRRDDRWPQADPASHFQPDGVFGPSEVIDHAYAWQHDGWTAPPARELVLYEVHVGTFSPAGDYAGLRARLGHLCDLGITAIKLMPLATWAGGRNWGYDGVFHFAPFAGYGRPHQLQQLVDACHGHGIAVLLDVVTNHFGPEGNAMWDLARPFFAREANTAWGPGPAFERDEVLAYFDTMARHFRQRYRMDGLRLDAVHAIAARHRRRHVERLAGALEDDSPAGSRSFLFLESIENEVSLLKDKDAGCSVLQLSFDFQRSLHRLLTGETHAEYSDHGDAEADVARCLADGLCFFERYSPLRKRKIGEPQQVLDWSTLVVYLTNHDSAGNRYLGERLQCLVDEETFRAATALLLLHPATPYLFMGQEWATKQPFYFFTDFEARLGERVAKGRKRGFHEVDLSRCDRNPPHPQSVEALERSKLDWEALGEERAKRHLAFTTELLALRKKLRPEICASTRGATVVHAGGCFRIELEAAERKQANFVLIANFGAEWVDLPAGERLFTSQPVDGERLPPQTTVLYRPR